jgi:P-type Cu+ transporter
MHTTADDAGHKPGDLLTVLLATNIHCASCVALVKELLSFYRAVKSVDVSVLQQEVRVHHGPEISTSDLARMLIDAAFEVQIATTQDVSASRVLESIDTSSWVTSPPVGRAPLLLSPASHSSRTVRGDREAYELQRRKHIENCEACRNERQEEEKAYAQLHDTEYGDARKEKLDMPALESVHVSQPRQPDVFNARISISGMTCGACANSVTETIQRLDFVKEVSVTLLTNSAAMTYTGPKENIDKVIDEVESTGFDAAVDTVEKISETEEDPEYEARFSIGGMTCASCVNSITHHVKQLDYVKDATVSLVTNSATVVFSGERSYSEKIGDEIEAIGYDASLIEVVQQNTPSDVRAASNKYIANISINGMSCGACVGKVTQVVQGLSYVNDVVVDLLSSSARVEFEGKDNAQTILDEIDDIGYEATLIDCKPLNEEVSKPTERTVMIRVDGMFCHHCPEKVLLSLKELDESIEISKGPTQKDPIVKIKYTPRQPDLTIRRIVSTINSSHETFKASIYHPPSIEDRSRVMQLRERRRFLFRLAFVFMVAIPTFLIGIVFMDLVPSDNKVRQYLSEPILGGSVSRMEWAMFFATTPVMFYGADVFHIRAMKEVHALWRPGSKVPLLRRFYRFGSMNLLISAGTSVAYIASLGVLIAGAASKSSSAMNVSTYFDSVVFLTLFILAGRSLEAYSKSKAGDAVSDLGKLRPSEALLVNSVSEEDEATTVGSGVERINVDLLEVGDTVIIPHGSSPPADGIVSSSSGKYQFDESSLTGESRPISKSSGDQIYSGSINVGQQVSVRVTEVGGASMLDKIVSVVREGQSKRAPMERVADVIVAYFVPIITLIAILTFIIWLALGQSGSLPLGYLDTSLGGWTFWSLQFAIAVFVVACPCGLALAAPTALFVGVGLAAKRGILVRGGGEAFQEATRLDAIVFDKTGTLTEGGNLKVSEHEVIDNADPQRVAIAWTLACELEQTSNHPIAKAIVEFCKDKMTMADGGRIGVRSSDILEISGQGMKGTFTLSVNGETKLYEAAIGNERLAQSVTSDSESYFFSHLLSKYQSSGRSTAVLLLREIKETGTDATPFTPSIIFATSDPIRSESAHVISQLQKRNISVYMCTGDNEKTAYAVASTLGIPHANVLANVMPAQKADFIRKIQYSSSPSSPEETTSQEPQQKNQTRKIVAFVGDGTNDSPALAASDVSIAMSSGSDVAISSSSFILLNSNLNSIFELVQLSRRVFNRIKLNFFWAAVYNVILVPVSAGVFYAIPDGTKYVTVGDAQVLVNAHWRLSPVWASLAMALSSVSVVTSSLALRVERRHVMKVVNWVLRR